VRRGSLKERDEGREEKEEEEEEEGADVSWPFTIVATINSIKPNLNSSIDQI